VLHGMISLDTGTRDILRLVRSQLDRAKAINNNLFGLQQFVIGKPIWEAYLKGQEPDPKVAMTKVMEAVQAEMKKG